MTRFFIASSLALLAAAPTSECTAQTVWQVPQGGDLQQFVDGAAPGDVLQLAGSPAESSISIDKSLTILGNTGWPSSVFRGSPSTIFVAASAEVRFVDFLFLPVPVHLSPYQSGYTAISGTGTAIFERCEFVGSLIAAAALAITDANVVLDHCTLEGELGARGLRAANANVTATDCTFLGAQPLYDSEPHSGGFFNSGEGILLIGNSTLHLTKSVAVGGNDVPDGSNPAKSGIRTDGPNCLVWLTDSLISGGNGGGSAGANALDGATFYHARCTLNGGAGLPPGAPFAGVAIADPTLVGADDDSTLERGETYAATFTADAGAILAVLYSPGSLARIDLPGVLAQPLWNDGSSLSQIAAGTTNASGDFSIAFTVPNDSTLLHRTAHFYGVRGGSLPVQLAPVLGGVIQ